MSHLRHITPGFLLIWLTVSSSFAHAQDTAAIAADGISILITDATADGNQVVLILKSDVALIRLLLLVNRHGAQWTEHVDEDIETQTFRARRLATLIRMLSSAARVLGEPPDSAARDAVIEQLRDRAGGRRAFRNLLDRCGVTSGDLKSWIAEMLLARSQLQAISDQLGPPAAINEPPETSSPQDVAWRELAENRRLRDALSAWLAATLNRGEVHFSDIGDR